MLVALPVLLHPHVASAQERRIVVTEGADYFGADYDVRKDVDLDACEAACRDDSQCRSFTYNVAAGWCFLKSDVGELRAVAGAISGRIVDEAEVEPDLEAQRVSELAFLAQTFVDEARRFVGRLEETAANTADLDAALAAAQAAREGGDLISAAELFRTALRLAPDRFDLWTSYTDTALRASSEDWQVQQRLTEDRTSGAINAYLHAASLEERAEALVLIGRSMAARYEWKPAIRAYRASLALVENDERRSAYQAMLDEHGFRIVDHVVEADAAAPRICLNFSDQLAQNRGDLADFVVVEGGANLAVEASGQQICVDGVEHGRRYHLVAREGLPAADGETLAKSADLDIFVRDRAPTVRFASNAYVLPAGGDPTIPVVTINTTRVNATLYRIGDRALARTIAEGNFLNQLSSWETDEIEAKSGVEVWTGTVDVSSETNREITTAIPVGAMEAELQPGAYVLTAAAVNAGPMRARPKRRSGSWSPISASPLSPAMTVSTSWPARLPPPARLKARGSASLPSTTRCWARPPPTPPATPFFRRGSCAAPAAPRPGSSSRRARKGTTPSSTCPARRWT
jgi:tetratricopeptide (TPR) repeat protein